MQKATQNGNRKRKRGELRPHLPTEKIRFANELERLINFDALTEEAIDEEDASEAKSPSIDAKSSEEMSTQSESANT